MEFMEGEDSDTWRNNCTEEPCELFWKALSHGVSNGFASFGERPNVKWWKEAIANSGDESLINFAESLDFIVIDQFASLCILGSEKCFRHKEVGSPEFLLTWDRIKTANTDNIIVYKDFPVWCLSALKRFVCSSIFICKKKGWGGGGGCTVHKKKGDCLGGEGKKKKGGLRVRGGKKKKGDCLCVYGAKKKGDCLCVPEHSIMEMDKTNESGWSNIFSTFENSIFEGYRKSVRDISKRRPLKTSKHMATSMDVDDDDDDDEDDEDEEMSTTTKGKGGEFDCSLHEVIFTVFQRKFLIPKTISLKTDTFQFEDPDDPTRPARTSSNNSCSLLFSFFFCSPCLQLTEACGSLFCTSPPTELIGSVFCTSPPTAVLSSLFGVWPLTTLPESLFGNFFFQ